MFSPDQNPSPRLITWAKLHVPGFAAACSVETVRAFMRDTGHARLPVTQSSASTPDRRTPAQAFTTGAVA